MSNLPMRIFGNRQWQGNNVSLAPFIRRGPFNSTLAIDAEDGLVWFWIGSHADCDKPVG